MCGGVDVFSLRRGVGIPFLRGVLRDWKSHLSLGVVDLRQRSLFFTS